MPSKTKKPKKTTLRNKADDLVRHDCYKKGKCEICGKTEELQWCHFITRACIKLRYNKKNYACLCAGCHFKGHDSPKWMTDRWDEIKGKGTAKWLDMESNNLEPITVLFYEKIIEEYKNLIQNL